MLHISSMLRTSLRELVSDDTSCPKIDIELFQRCIHKMKLNKSPGFDNVSTEHLLYGGGDLYVHLCLLFNTMVQHCYVPEKLGHGLLSHY